MTSSHRANRRLFRVLSLIVPLFVVLSTIGTSASAIAQTATEETPSPEPSPDPGPASPDPGPTSSPEPSPSPDPEPVGSPTIASDKDDYPPGGDVILSGADWRPDEIVHIRVNDDQGETWHRDVDVVADANGAIRDEFQLPDWFVATYVVTATGPLSGIATTTFTDSNMRFLSSGPVLTSVSWQLYSNSACTTALPGSANNGSGNITTTDDSTGTLNVAATGGQWLGLTAPASIGGQDFINWVNTSGGAAFTTSGPGNRTICVTGENNNGLRRLTANYTTNAAPDAVNDIRTFAEDSGTDAVNPLSNDTDANSDTLNVTAVSDPAHGTATIVGGGANVNYTPDTNYNGADSFTYTISDGHGGADTATVSISVTAVNDAPVNTVPGAQSTTEDTTLTFSTANANGISVADVDVAETVGGKLKLSLSVTNGTVSLTGTAGLVFSTGDGIGDAAMVFTGLTADVNAALDGLVYAPTANFSGSASLSFSTEDQGNTGSGGNKTDSDSVAITVNSVNDAPDAVNDSRAFDEDSGANAVNPLSNDADVDGDTLTVASVSDPPHGTATIVSAGANVNYTPDADFHGADSFTYTISDGHGGTDTATVSVNVNAVNDAPVCQDVEITTDEDNAGQTDPVCADVDGDALTYTVSAASDGESGFVAGEITYDPDPDFNGTDAFTYTANDGTVDSAAATVSVTVTEVNDAPDAANDSATVAEDGDVLVNVRSNDSTGPANEGGQSLTITAVGAPAHGTAVLESGQIRYTPAADYNGPDSFTYTITDDGTTAGAPDPLSDTATVSVTVTPVNDAPVIDSASFGVASVGCPTTLGAVNATLTTSFHDVDSGDAHVASIDWDSNPATTGDNQNLGAVTSPFSMAHSYPAAGTYTATVTVSDGSLSDSESKSITVNYNVVGGSFKQPVNNTRNGQATSIFKWGSTIPLKLEVTDCNGSHPSLEIRVHWQQLLGGVPQGELEAVATNNPDLGNLMRLVDSHYMFNWNTRLASDPTSTVRIQATIVSVGQVIYSDIGLKK